MLLGTTTPSKSKLEKQHSRVVDLQAETRVLAPSIRFHDDVSFSFLCGLREYHKYHLLWNPTMLEELLVRQEQDNTHDRYAIALFEKATREFARTVVGHFPKEISRFTYYILLRGARLSAKVVDTQHRRSPLVQGGLEIPIEVTLAMECSE